MVYAKSLSSFAWKTFILKKHTVNTRGSIKYPPVPAEKRLIFRPSITIKGETIYASSFSKKAFFIFVYK